MCVLIPLLSTEVKSFTNVKHDLSLVKPCCCLAINLCCIRNSVLLDGTKDSGKNLTVK